MYKLRPSVQHYAWGRLPINSTVFKYSLDKQSIGEDQPCAELWMGTHPKGESIIEILENEALPLSTFLENVKPGSTLPFLFKILSIEKCLSIQAHPTKELGKILHESQPENYPDDNYKPEMAIALTQFTAFSNFCPKTEIIDNLEGYSILKDSLSLELSEMKQDGESDEQLKSLFLKLLDLDETVVHKVVQEAQDREVKSLRDQIVIQLNEQFPGDNGIIVSLTLNYLDLHPGQCFMMNPLEPHAYLSGECIEGSYLH